MNYLLSQMEEALNLRDQVLNEKAELLAEREILLDEEVNLLKAQLVKEKEKTMEAEFIAEQALQAGMKATRNWEKEKKRRKIAEEILHCLQGILHDSVAAGLVRAYQPVEPDEPVFTKDEIMKMDKKTVKGYCQRHGIDTEGKGTVYLKRELLKIVEESAEPVQEPAAEPVQEPSAELVQEPTAELVQEPTAEPVQEPTAEPVQEQETPTARYVVTIYEKFLNDVEVPHFWNMKLLIEHANQLGIENTGQDKVTLRGSVRQAINENVPVVNPLVLLGHIEERLKQKTSGILNKSTLLAHCKYYNINTVGKNKVELKDLLLKRLT